MPSDLDEALDALAGMVAQECAVDSDATRITRITGELDSFAVSSHATALRLLARHGRVTIVSDVGRRVLANWTKEDADAEKR
jgi:hypothetical protein